MKRMAFLLQLSLFVGGIRAQPPYPTAPPPPGNLVQLEYFIDTDPGFGNGTPVNVPVPQPDLNNFAFSISTTGLPQGYYRLYLRSRDANGRWSHTHYAFFSNVVAPVYPVAPPAPVNIIKLEYAIDANPAFGSGTPISITPGTNIANQSAVISTTGLAAGPHILYIRSQDANGRWSLTNISFFDNSVAPPYPAAPAPATNLQQMEYFIDTDPGFGQGTPVSFAPGTNITTSFAVNGIANGDHVFYIRSRNNPWSITNAVPFSVGVVTPVTWLFVRGQMLNRASQITWGTAQETNTAMYEVEHSVNGSRFTKIGEVAAAGNSNTPRYYSFNHHMPVEGFNYYRIKQVDRDGTFRYSVIVTLLNLEALLQTVLAPNPVKDMLHVAEPKETHIVMAEIFQLNGTRVFTQPIGRTVQVFSISTGQLAAGQYVLKIFYRDKTVSRPFVKQ
jgi:hypothetical protein